MAIKDFRIPLVPATASGATALSTAITAGGWLEAIRLVRPTTNQITTVANITISDQLTGMTYFAATATATGSQEWHPRNAVLVNASNAALGLTSAATPPPAYDKFPVPGNSRFRVIVASGGANTSGVLHIFLSGA
jgi:hypothetical protein